MINTIICTEYEYVCAFFTDLMDNNHIGFLSRTHPELHTHCKHLPPPPQRAHMILQCSPAKLYILLFFEFLGFQENTLIQKLRA